MANSPLRSISMKDTHAASETRGDSLCGQMFETGKFLWKNSHRAGKLLRPLCLFRT